MATANNVRYGVPTPDSTSSLTEALGAILPALEAFQRFATGPDPTVQNVADWGAKLHGPLPQKGSGEHAVLEMLRDIVIPHGIRIGHPGFCSHITTAPTKLAIIAQLSAMISGAQREWNHSYNALEDLALRWLAEVMGLCPDNYQGIFTAGGASANLHCLVAARQHAYQKKEIDASQDGIARLSCPRFYMADQVNGVLPRDVSIMGFGRDAVVLIPSNKDFQLDVQTLRIRLQADIAAGCTPIAIIATAGTTSTGAIDPLEETAELCREMDIWFHVDGAYGLPGILDPRVTHLYKGLSDANSWVIDPHKWFGGVPIGSGAAFVRIMEDEALLQHAFALGPAPFLATPHADDVEITSPYDTWGIPFGDRGLDSSAPSRGAAVWAMLESNGVEGLRALIQEHNTFARDLASLVDHSEFLRRMAPVTLSICCFQCVLPGSRGHEGEMVEQLNDFNRQVLKRVRASGIHTPSYTTLNGAFVLRACFINPRTDKHHVVGLFEEVHACCAEIVRNKKVC